MGQANHFDRTTVSTTEVQEGRSPSVRPFCGRRLHRQCPQRSSEVAIAPSRKLLPTEGGEIMKYELKLEILEARIAPVSVRIDPNG